MKIEKKENGVESYKDISSSDLHSFSAGAAKKSFVNKVNRYNKLGGASSFGKASSSKKIHDEFNEITDIVKEKFKKEDIKPYKPTMESLNSITASDIKSLRIMSKASDSLLVSSLVYVGKIKNSVNSSILDKYTKSDILVGCLALAAKYNTDYKCDNKDMSPHLGIKPKDLTKVETAILKAIDYKANYTKDEFNKATSEMQKYDFAPLGRKFNGEQVKKKLTGTIRKLNFSYYSWEST